MYSAQSSRIDLPILLTTRAITTYFQPIISVGQHTVIGYEALSRGIQPSTKDLIMPNDLFSLAAASNQLVELDRLCREKALENYSLIAAGHNCALLFVNLDTAIIDNGVVGSGNLLGNVQRFNLSPTSIVIEIIESKVCDIQALKTFIRTYKNLGFLIALDDVGNGHSNLDRIFHVRPDIIKIDRWLITEIDQDYYKQELFKALVHMAKKTGSLVVAEGIETQSEALACLEFGADMLQGYYFSKPKPGPDTHFHYCSEKINHVAAVFKNHKFEKISSACRQKKDYCQVLQTILIELGKNTPDQFETTLQAIVTKLPLMQYIYVLNMAGIQITDTIEAPGITSPQNAGIFQAAHKGTDQSQKDYCMFIQADLDQYITETYISLANGKPCVTYSMTFKDCTNSQYILCADFTP